MIETNLDQSKTILQKRPANLARVAAFILFITLGFVYFSVLSLPQAKQIVDFSSVLQVLNSRQTILLLATAIHALLLYQATHWLILSGIGLFFACSWNGFHILIPGIQSHAVTMTLTILPYFLAHLPLLGPKTRRVLIYPSLQWWRMAPRRKARVRANIRPVLGGDFSSNTIDISLSGAFISTEKSEWISHHATHPRNLRPGARCAIRFMLDRFQVLHCGAEVVRHAAPIGEYPQGFAVRFIRLNQEQKKLLNKFLRQDNNSINAM